MIRMRFFRMVVVLSLALFFCIGCDSEKRSGNIPCRAVAEHTLSKREVEVKSALIVLLTNKINSATHKGESSSTKDFIDAAVRLMHTSASNLNQHAIISRLRQDVLAMEISGTVVGGSHGDAKRNFLVVWI